MGHLVKPQGSHFSGNLAWMLWFMVSMLLGCLLLTMWRAGWHHYCMTLLDWYFLMIASEVIFMPTKKPQMRIWKRENSIRLLRFFRKFGPIQLSEVRSLFSQHLIPSGSLVMFFKPDILCKSWNVMTPDAANRS